MAPDAAIVVLTSPVSETEGVQGMPEFAQLVKYALDHRLGQVISQSWGATSERDGARVGGRHGQHELRARPELAVPDARRRIPGLVAVGHERGRLDSSVPGYDAGPGCDLATGWGSPDVGSLLRSIAAMPAQN